MAEHTPGPWTVTPEKGRAPSQAALLIYAPTGRGSIARMFYGLAQICGVRSLGPSLELTKANARLIAAAPDLLAALKPLAAIAQTWTDRLDDCPDDGHIWSGHRFGYTGGQLRAALAAIAKAEGAAR